MPAIEDGVAQGKQVGNFIANKLMGDDATGITQHLPEE
jgi:hypothetical protein